MIGGTAAHITPICAFPMPSTSSNRPPHCRHHLKQNSLQHWTSVTFSTYSKNSDRIEDLCCNSALKSIAALWHLSTGLWFRTPLSPEPLLAPLTRWAWRRCTRLHSSINLSRSLVMTRLPVLSFLTLGSGCWIWEVVYLPVSRTGPQHHCVSAEVITPCGSGWGGPVITFALEAVCCRLFVVFFPGIRWAVT